MRCMKRRPIAKTTDMSVKYESSMAHLSVHTASSHPLSDRGLIAYETVCQKILFS